MQELIGKIITGIEIDNEQQEYLVFHIKDEEPIAYYADGECCSSSWFYSVMDGMLLIGEPVLDVEEVEMPEGRWNDESGGELIQFYGYAIKSPRGVCRVEFRNESNGYYGGSLCTTYIRNVPKDRLRFLAGDYTTGLDGNVII